VNDSQRYRYNAAECLRAAHAARQPHYRRLYLLMASTWLSMARLDSRTFDLLASWGMAEPMKADEVVVLPRRFSVLYGRHQIRMRSRPNPEFCTGRSMMTEWRSTKSWLVTNPK
jgi:hypothetical protein